MAFTVNVVRQLHQMLYRYQPATGGRWKSTQNDIVERAPDGSILKVRFRPVSPVATPGAMDELTGRWARAVDQQREPLILIPLAILDFLCIHPFTDGNGRTARLLTLLLLYQDGYSVGRYIGLERVIEDGRDTYSEALERSSADWHAGKHDPFPWLEYFWGMLLRAYDEFRDRAGRVLEGRGSKTALVEAAVARRSAPFAISEIEEDCPGVSRDPTCATQSSRRRGVESRRTRAWGPMGQDWGWLKRVNQPRSCTQPATSLTTSGWRSRAQSRRRAPDSSAHHGPRAAG